jgi:hypothetical protein
MIKRVAFHRSRHGVVIVIAAVIALLAPVSAVFPGASAAAAATTTPGGYVPVPWARIMDTTAGVGVPLAPAAANATLTFTAAGKGGVPASGAGAVVLNVTAKTSKAAGSLTVYPSGAAKPAGANLTFAKGATVSNLVTVALGTAGQIKITNGSTGTTQITADVVGYFVAGSPTAAGAFAAVASARVLDTSTGIGVPTAPLAPNGSVSANVADVGGVPASGVSSVVLNVTAKSPTAAGTLTAYPAGAAKPAGATLTYPAGGTVSNLVTVALGPAGNVTLTNGSTGTTHASIDVLGYFVGGTPAVAGTFAALPAAHVLDTTTGLGTPKAQIPAAGTITTTINGAGGVPASGVAAVVLNVTAKNATAAGALKVYTAGTFKPPGAYLTFAPGTTLSELAVVAPSAAGAVSVTSTSTGKVDVTADVLGYVLAGTSTPPPPGAPTVTGLSPASGPAAGATPVTITGTNFTGATAVKFGTTAATFSVTNATTIAATVPAGTGTVDVTVTTSGGTSTTSAADKYTYVAAPPPAPTVTGLSPVSGTSSGGTAVTVTGTNLTGATAVKFGTTAATFSVTNATTIAATAPAGTGTVDVTVTTSGGTSTTNTADRYTYVTTPPPPPPAPTVTGLNPTSGSTAGGTPVTITGANFTGATTVKFGATSISFTVTNATTIVCTSPAGTGTVDVTVTTSGGTSTTNAADAFTYITPPPPGTIPSPVAGGWQLNGSAALVTTATPANLQLTQTTNYQAGSAFYPTPVPGAGISATFDAFIGPGTGADGMTFTLADASATQPTALGVMGGGEGYSGLKGIAVSLDTWQNTGDPAANFVGIATTNTPQQVLNYVTTNTTVPTLRNTIHHFVVTTSTLGIIVTMDGTQVLNYPTTLPQYVLVGFTGGTGGFNDVQQVQNVSISSGAPAPTSAVTSVSPNSGPNTGGTTVTITGSNFLSVSGVNFGSAAAAFTPVSPTSITATAPAGTGTVDVTVTNGAGTSGATANDRFAYVTGPPPPPSAPTVSGISPASGPTAGGNTVTITGTNFTTASAVNFGPNPATFVADTSTSITATVPVSTAGPVDVTVTNDGGTSTTNPNDLYTYVTGPPQAPVVASIDPVSAPAGTQVTIGGTSFTTTSAVHFGSAATTFTVNNDHTITATAPPGTGTVDVTVTNAVATSSVSQDDEFTYGSGPPTNPVPSPVAGGWTLNGSAALVTTATPKNLQLTPNSQWQAGSAFWPTPVPGVGVSASFDAFIGPGAGADGMTFVLANANDTKATALGSQGSGEGYNGIDGIAVSLDHYKNPADPSSNFVGIATNLQTGNDSLNYVTTNSSIGTLINTVHHFKVTTTNLGIAVTMDGVQVLNYTTTLPQYVLLGFTASTGGGTDIHQVQNVSITAGPPPPTPKITSISPASGPSTGGTTVTITGSGLLSAAAPKFGANAATDYLVQNDSVVTATAPVGNLGTVDITVTTAGGTTATSAADKYTYVVPPVPTVTGVSPASGPSTGGTTVSLTGTGFSGATAINFGPNNPAIFYTIKSPTSIIVTAPAGTLGIQDVRVVTPGGTSPPSAADSFTYTVPPAPAVTKVSPASGPNGTFVTITGTNFAGATAVNFGATAATSFTVNSPTSISANAPSGSGFVDVTVVTPGGTSLTNANAKYTYTVPDAPTVTGLSPSTGFAGYSIAITGTNLTAASAVKFGGTSATFTVNTDTSITATAPAGTGTVDVVVTTSGGTSATGVNDQFTYQSGPPPPTQVATYRGDLGRTGYYPAETALTTSNVVGLKQHWVAKGGTGSFAQPIVANNLVYWGDWNGLEHATTLAGTDAWTYPTGTNTDASCLPAEAGISGTVTIGQMGGTSVVYVPGGDDNMYALNAQTGALLWKTNLGTQPAWYLWSSPILFNGSLYEGIASFGDCPLVQGQLVQMNAATGAIQHVASFVPDGCVGAGVWTSPTVDPSDGSVYVTTGTPAGCKNPGPNLAPSIVKLRASDLSILSSWTVPTSEQTFGDEDFGGTPTLFTATINGVQRQLVGALNKDGLFFAWDRGDVAAGPVWQSTTADPSGSPRSILSAAWDGKYLYVGGGSAIINGASCYGNLSALDPATGGFIWRSCQDFMTGGITEIPGMIIEGTGAGGQVKFLNTANGATVLTFNSGSMVQGEVTVSNGVVYIPQANGNLMAAGL